MDGRRYRRHDDAPEAEAATATPARNSIRSDRPVAEVEDTDTPGRLATSARRPARRTATPATWTSTRPARQCARSVGCARRTERASPRSVTAAPRKPEVARRAAISRGPCRRHRVIPPPRRSRRMRRAHSWQSTGRIFDMRSKCRLQFARYGIRSAKICRPSLSPTPTLRGYVHRRYPLHGGRGRRRRQALSSREGGFVQRNTDGEADHDIGGAFISRPWIDRSLRAMPPQGDNRHCGEYRHRKSFVRLLARVGETAARMNMDGFRRHHDAGRRRGRA